MARFDDLFLLLLLASIVVAWLKLSRLRELAAAEARRQCERHGLQLLDETVGLSSLRLRRLDGMRVIERGYSFEVSIDGSDRHRCHLDLAGQRLEAWSLPLGDEARSRIERPTHLRLVQ